MAYLSTVSSRKWTEELVVSDQSKCVTQWRTEEHKVQCTWFCIWFARLFFHLSIYFTTWFFLKKSAVWGKYNFDLNKNGWTDQAAEKC